MFRSCLLFVSFDVNPQGFAFFGGDKSPSFGVGLFFSYCFALGNHIECMSWIPLFLMLFSHKSLRPSYLWVHNQTIFNGLQSLHLVATLFPKLDTCDIDIDVEPSYKCSASCKLIRLLANPF
jgi:hypothetical protein